MCVLYHLNIVHVSVHALHCAHADTETERERACARARERERARVSAIAATPHGCPLRRGVEGAESRGHLLSGLGREASDKESPFDLQPSLSAARVLFRDRHGKST